MADHDNDTPTANDGTQDPEASATADANGNASQTGQDEVSVLRSRYAGQTAKVNELTESNKSLQAQLAAHTAELEKLRKGEADKDEVTKLALAAKEEEIASIRRQAALDRIEAKFPETFAELGEAAVSLTEEKLASMEARLRGAAVEEQEPPTPRGNNAARTESAPQGGQGKEQSSADILAQMRALPLPPEWGG